MQRRSGDRLDPFPAPQYPFSSHLFDATDGDTRERKTSLKTLLSVPRLDLREYSLQKAHRVALFICPVCPVMRWTSIALFNAINCTSFELGDGGVGDRAISYPEQRRSNRSF